MVLFLTLWPILTKVTQASRQNAQGTCKDEKGLEKQPVGLCLGPKHRNVVPQRSPKDLGRCYYRVGECITVALSMPCHHSSTFFLSHSTTANTPDSAPSPRRHLRSHAISHQSKTLILFFSANGHLVKPCASRNWTSGNRVGSVTESRDPIPSIDRLLSLASSFSVYPLSFSLAVVSFVFLSFVLLFLTLLVASVV